MLTQDVTFVTTLIKHNELYWFLTDNVKAMKNDEATPVFFDLETTGLGIANSLTHTLQLYMII